MDRPDQIGSPVNTHDQRHWVAEHDPLTIRRWNTIRHSGVPVDSPATEIMWLPILGPSAMAVVRQMVRVTEDGPVSADLEELSLTCGMGQWVSSSANICRVIARTVKFGFACIDGETLKVLAFAPNMTERQRAMLPECMKERIGA